MAEQFSFDGMLTRELIVDLCVASPFSAASPKRGEGSTSNKLAKLSGQVPQIRFRTL